MTRLRKRAWVSTIALAAWVSGAATPALATQADQARDTVSPAELGTPGSAASDLAGNPGAGNADRGAKVPKRVFPQTINGTTILYDNGPLITHPAGGSGGADASALQTTTLVMNTLGFGHADTTGFRMADDFVVTDASGWDVESITFFAYQTGSTTTSTMDHVNLQIWDGPPGAGGSTVVFGDTTTNRLASTSWGNVYRTTLTTMAAIDRPIMESVVTAVIHLDPGTYWLDWQTGGTLASGPWAPPITILGTAVTGNGQQFNPTPMTWGPALDTGTGTPAQGLPFVIEGNVTAVAEVTLTKTVSDVLGVCGTTDTISVPAGTQVDYCFTVENTGSETLNYHTLVDSHLGTILNNDNQVLDPGDTLEVLVTDTVTQTVTNSATWFARVDPPSAVTSVTVEVNGITHTWPDDIDLLLVGPGGENLVILSDVGDSIDIAGVSLLLDDAAGAALPDAAILTTGTFRPGNFSGTGDLFPSPAPTSPWGQPAPAGAATLTSIFGGTDPNGTWSLFAHDQFAGDAGTISEWCINVQPGAVRVCNGTDMTVGTTAGPFSPYPSEISFQDTPDATSSDTATVTALFPDAAVDPVSMSSTLGQGGSESQVLTIDNDGDAPLDWDLVEAPGVLGGTGTILNQLPDQVNGLFTDVACALCTTTGTQSMADNFALAATEQVGVITFWGGYFPGNVPTTSDPFRVLIQSDAGGFPGTVVYDESNVASTRQTTGIVLFGVDEWIFTLTLATPVTLPPGSYWLQIFNHTGTGASPDDFFWETGSPDTVGNGLAGTAFATAAPGVAWAAASATDLAVQLDPNPSGCDTPADLPWLGLTSTSGSTAPLSSSTIAVTFFAGSLPVGLYEGTLCLESNDPDSPRIEIPVSLTVDTMPFLDGFESGDTSEWSSTVL